MRIEMRYVSEASRALASDSISREVQPFMWWLRLPKLQILYLNTPISIRITKY